MCIGIYHVVSTSYLTLAMASCSSKDERPLKLQRLDEFKRKVPHVSASALSAILNEIKESGVPELGNRKQIMEATQGALSCTSYGPLIQTAVLNKLDGSKQQVCFVNPLSLLAAAALQGGSYSNLLRQTMNDKGCSFEKPFSVMLYCDEIVAGNPLAHTTSRKVWAFYMSILELGPLMLQKEQAWLTVLVMRSSLASTLSAGVSQLYKLLLRSIFLNPECNVQCGLGLKFQDGEIRHLFLKMGGILQDGGAHKATWSGKGDAGTKFCILCKNLISNRSNLVYNQDGEALLTSCMHSLNDLVLASNDDIYNSIDALVYKKDVFSAQQFKMWEQAAGFVYEPDGLLFDKELRGTILPVDHFIHDYMHCILCNGVMATVLTLLLTDLDATKSLDVYATLYKYLAFWHLPRAKPCALSELFSAKKKKANKEANTFKATASEFLSLYPILAYLMQQVWVPAKLCVEQCNVFLELCNLLDLLQAIPVCNVTPHHLQHAVQDLYAKLVRAEWVDYFHSKFHWLIHFSGELHNLKCLPSCFTHERKHRMVKRYLGSISNTIALERSVMQEVVAHDLFEGKQPQVFSTNCRLEKQSKAPKKMLAFLAEHITFATCFTSASLLLHPVGKVCKSDIALYKDGAGSLQSGEVWFHCELDGALWTLLSLLELRHYSAESCSALWVKSGNTCLVASKCILCPLIWKEHNNDELVTLMPLQFRPQNV